MNEPVTSEKTEFQNHVDANKYLVGAAPASVATQGTFWSRQAFLVTWKIASANRHEPGSHTPHLSYLVTSPTLTYTLESSDSKVLLPFSLEKLFNHQIKRPKVLVVVEVLSLNGNKLIFST